MIGPRKNILCALYLIFTFAWNANASQFSDCTTIKECKDRIFQDQATLIKLQTSKFVPVYIDSKGLEWSKTLPSLYRNGCVGENDLYDTLKCTYRNDGRERQVEITDSDAAKACHKIGARLPTKEELNILYFDFLFKNYGEMFIKFGDTNIAFWSSSVNPDDPTQAFSIFFPSNVNDKIKPENRYHELPVRCVSSPTNR